MADDEKQVSTAAAPTDRSARPSDSTAGTVTEAVRDEARNEVSTAPKTVEEQRSEYLSSMKGLKLNQDGTFDPKTADLFKIPVVGAPPAESGQKTPADKAKAAAGEVKLPGEGARPEAGKVQEVVKPLVADGKIDVPADAPAQIKEQVEKLNKHLADPKNELTAAQRKDIELSAEQIVGNKNPDGSTRKPPIDAAEVPKVLEQTNRMFDKTAVIEANGFTKEQRNLNATAMIHDIATPIHADQGMNNTCATTGVAKAEMMTTPGEQAKRNVDMFANESNKDSKGMFVMHEGRKVYYDAASISGDREAAYTANHRGGGGRDAYMQALNHLYNNIETQKRGEFYKEVRTTEPGDTGERLAKGGFDGELVTDANGKRAMGPNLVGEDVQSLMTSLGVGRLAADFSGMGMDARRAGNAMNVDANGKSLDAAWEANGRKPMVLAVNTNSDLFRAASGVGGKSEGGGHVVMVSDQRTGANGQKEYFLHNWGEKHGGWVSGDALASSMNPGKGDRSGQGVPVASGGESKSGNWQDKVLTRPTDSRGANGESIDGSDYGNTNAPRRDPNGILTGEDRKAEMDRRQQMDESKNKDDAAARDKRNREEAELREQEAKKRWADDPNNPASPNHPDNIKKKKR